MAGSGNRARYGLAPLGLAPATALGATGTPAARAARPAASGAGPAAGTAVATAGVSATIPSTQAARVATDRRMKCPPSGRPRPPPRTAPGTLLKCPRESTVVDGTDVLC